MRQRFIAGATDAATRVPVDVLDELIAVFPRHTQQVGDHQQREGSREPLDEITPARGQELVEHLIGEQPHGVLVLLEALWGDQPHQQCAVIGVGRRVQCRQLVAERQLVAVLLDQLRDVVTIDGDREAGERTRHRNARGEGVGVVQHRAGLVPAGHHRDSVMAFPRDGALLPQGLVVGVRVLDQPGVPEEIHLGELVHHVLLRSKSRLVRMCLSETSITFPYRHVGRQRAAALGK